MTTHADLNDTLPATKEAAYDDFNNLKVTTTTQIAIVLNTTFDLEKIFEQIPEFEPSDYKAPYPDLKSKLSSTFFENILPKGTIIHAKYKDRQKGIQLKKKRKTLNYGKRNFFLNAICMVVHTHKIINFKITNSKFQITGCQDTRSAHELVQLMIDKFLQFPIKCVNYEAPINRVYPKFDVVFNTVMTNVDFNLRFLVDRMNLDKLYSDAEEFISILENSFGHAGVNIKYFSRNHNNKMLSKMSSDPNGMWSISKITYKEFFDSLPKKDQDYESKKKQIHTLLIFHSGKGIISGPCITEMRTVYDKFIKVLHDNKDRYAVEEKLIQ